MLADNEGTDDEDAMRDGEDEAEAEKRPWTARRREVFDRMRAARAEAIARRRVERSDPYAS
eukprot:4270134-Prymnesium_polylepis.1